MIAAGLAMMVLALAAAFMVALSEQQGAVEDRDQDLDREIDREIEGASRPTSSR